MNFIFFTIFFTLTSSSLALPSELFYKALNPDYLYPENNRGGRIVGGQVTSIEEIDYIASLQRNGAHSCGVVIVSENFVLTAAHCVQSVAATSLRVRVGSSFHARDGSLVAISRILSHPLYVPSTIDYDYAILLLQTRLTFGIGINPISLPLPGETIDDDTYTWTSGWGRTMVAEESNEQLRKVDIPIVNRERCRVAYETRNVVTERMICAGYYYDGGKDACQGDSGGPLAYHTSSGRRVLYGLTSWGLGCARPGFPGVWAYIPAVLDWIYENTDVKQNYSKN